MYVNSAKIIIKLICNALFYINDTRHAKRTKFKSKQLIYNRRVMQLVSNPALKKYKIIILLYISLRWRRFGISVNASVKHVKGLMLHIMIVIFKSDLFEAKEQLLVNK